MVRSTRLLRKGYCTANGLRLTACRLRL